MKLKTKLVAMTAVLSLLPAVSYGESYSQPTYPRTTGPDVAYCTRLSNLYARYIGNDWQDNRHAQRRADNDAQVAMTQCETNTPSAISVLERELKANRFTLPPRG
jgi:hypothetical protein